MITVVGTLRQNTRNFSLLIGNFTKADMGTLRMFWTEKWQFLAAANVDRVMQLDMFAVTTSKSKKKKEVPSLQRDGSAKIRKN